MKYTGGCHCGKVQYEIEAEISSVIECNCSHCAKKGFLLTFIPKESFTLISGANDLTEYLFNKKTIRHVFCATCGVESFAEGIAFPQMAINVRCLDGIDLSSLTINAYNGKDI